MFKNKILSIRKKENGGNKSRMSFVLAKWYTKLVFLGFALTGLQATFLPKLVICSSLFGDKACDPLGNYFITAASLPGYLFAGIILTKFPKTPVIVYFIVLFLLSLVIYFMLGKLIDRLKQRSIKREDLLIFSAWLGVIVLFIVLLFMI